MTAAKISITGLSKVYGATPQAVLPLVVDGIGKEELLRDHGHVLALRDVGLEIAAQRVHVVMGLSGSGKSTLLRHINRLIEPTAGEVRIDETEVTALGDAALRDLRRYRIAMVFQRFALFPHRTVAGNIAYGLSLRGVPRGERARRVAEWIERVGLSGYGESYPRQLSGGMQQRVGLARALATDAEILLMDEPFGALDPVIRIEMQALLLELQRDLRKTVVFVTHDLDEAVRLGDRITILRDGAVVQTDSPERIILKPASEHVATFTADINRGRLLSIGAIMTPPGREGGGPDLPPDTTLETALARMSLAGHDRARVVDANGRATGVVTLEGIVRALAPPG